MRPDRLFLSDILKAIDLVAQFIALGRESFLNDVKTQDAVIRRIEVIGEAARHLSDELRSRHPELPWSRIIGMRNELAHGYFSVDLNIVWIAAAERLPAMRQPVQAILDGLDA